MKNRRFPYGYEMRCGQIIICAAEAESVKRIFDDYLAGANLKNIAETLTKRQVEYLPGECGWNKSRIKRIIEDKRYIGDDTYPAIVDRDIFRKANAEKDGRRTYTTPTITAENKQLVGIVLCGECGGRLLHRTDSKKKNSETWYCHSDHCKCSIPMSVAELEKDVTAILNLLIADPALAEHNEPEMTAELSLEIHRMENEIERQIEALDFDKTELQNMILRCAAKKYNEHKSARHITDRLKADFEKSGPLSNFNMEFLDRTVSAVIIDKNKTVGLKLKNKKIIGKELQSNDDTSHSESSQSNPPEAGILRRESN